MKAWRQVHPGNPHEDRTLKSYVCQEAEGFSREAKLAWCEENGHHPCNLQHDGVVVAISSKATPEAVRRNLREAGERRLGYCQPVEIKPAEMPEGWTAVPTSLEEIQRQLPKLQIKGTTRTGLWNLAETLQDPEGYTAAATPGIGADPVLRLFLRDAEMETGTAVNGIEGEVAVTIHGQAGVGRAARSTGGGLQCRTGIKRSAECRVRPARGAPL